MDAIKTQSLCKRFPEKKNLKTLFGSVSSPFVVDGVTISIKQGELFGLVGPNGAGKTTLIKTLSTLIRPTSGDAWVNGYPLMNTLQVRSSIGLVTSDERSFYWRLTGRQNLTFFAELHGLPVDVIPPRVDNTLNLVNLSDKSDIPYRLYSTGMRQRLAIARALVHKPDVLLLDEPSRGLDPAETQRLHNLIRDELVNRSRLSILLTSHRLDEISKLCDRIAIMNQGKIIVMGAEAEIRDEFGTGHSTVINYQPNDQTIQDELFIEDPKIQWAEPGRIEIVDRGDGSLPLAINRTIDRIRAMGGEILTVIDNQITLENLFSKAIESSLENINTSSPGEPVEEQDELSGIENNNEPPSRNAVLRTLRAFFWVDFQNEITYPLAFILQFSNIFLNLGIFYFIAQLLGSTQIDSLDGYGGDYFAFVLIGLAFTGYFGIGLNSFANKLRQAQTTGTIEAILSTPVRVSTMIVGTSLWDYFLTTLRSFVYLGLGVVLGGITIQTSNLLFALLILLLSVLTFASIGVFAASFIMVLKRGNPITWFFGAFSSLFGGVYYPIDVLPDWLTWISKLIPLTYSLEGLRISLLIPGYNPQIWIDILVLMGFCCVLIPASLYTFRKAVEFARIDGSLSQY